MHCNCHYGTKAPTNDEKCFARDAKSTPCGELALNHKTYPKTEESFRFALPLYPLKFVVDVGVVAATMAGLSILLDYPVAEEKLRWSLVVPKFKRVSVFVLDFQSIPQ